MKDSQLCAFGDRILLEEKVRSDLVGWTFMQRMKGSWQKCGSLWTEPLDIFPEDLLHRVLVAGLFAHIEEHATLYPHYNSRKQSTGFRVEQCRAFWDRNALCLSEKDREVLAKHSTGLSPRDLQLSLQRVLIATCWKAKEEDKTPETMSFPTLDDFMAFIKPAEQVIVDMELHEAPFPVPSRLAAEHLGFVGENQAARHC